MNYDKKKINYSVDITILVLFIAIALNGLLLQIIYHMKHYDPDYIFMNFNKDGWLIIHKVLSITLMIGIGIHVLLHLNWFKSVIINKRYLNRDFKSKHLFYLLVVFFITALVGYLSWVFTGFGDDSELRQDLVEIHDKLTIVLILLFLIHFVKKIKWLYHSTIGFAKYKN